MRQKGVGNQHNIPFKKPYLRIVPNNHPGAFLLFNKINKPSTSCSSNWRCWIAFGKETWQAWQRKKRMLYSSLRCNYSFQDLTMVLWYLSQITLCPQALRMHVRSLPRCWTRMRCAMLCCWSSPTSRTAEGAVPLARWMTAVMCCPVGTRSQRLQSLPKLAYFHCSSFLVQAQIQVFWISGN